MAAINFALLAAESTAGKPSLLGGKSPDGVLLEELEGREKTVIQSFR